MSQKVAIVGMPSSIGGNMHGCEKGPKALRESLIPKLEKQDIPYTDFGDMTKPCSCDQSDTEANCLVDIKQLYSQTTAFLQEKKVFDPQHFPVLLGGDHSCNYSFIRESARNRKLGIIWFDAHGDFNTPSISPSGNIHGMVLSALAGIGLVEEFGDTDPIVLPQNIAIVGTRDLDPQEEDLLNEMGVCFFSMTEIQNRGLKAVTEDAIAIASKETDGIHLSFDMDVFDPIDAPDVSVPAKNGFHKDDVKIIGKCFQNNKPVSIDIVEVNPFHGIQHNKTAEIGAEIVLAFVK